MPIVRIKKRENPFVQIDKEAINNPSLSWKAKGLLTYLISKPDNWRTKIKDLEKKSTDGRAACRSGLQELEQSGYIIKRHIRDDKGQYSKILYDVFESPQLNENFNESPFKGNRPKNKKPDSGFNDNQAIDGKSDSGFKDDESTNGFPINGKSGCGKSNTTNNDSNNNKKPLKKTTTKTTGLEITSEIEKVISCWNKAFEIEVDVDDKTLINAIREAVNNHTHEELFQAIEFRSLAKFYKEEKPYLRDNPKMFFEYPQNIRNDMQRYPYKLITYEKKCELEQRGTDKKFEMDPVEKDNQGRPKWRMYG